MLGCGLLCFVSFFANIPAGVVAGFTALLGLAQDNYIVTLSLVLADELS